MSAHASPRMTPEQYLEIERAAEFKSDFYDGHMYSLPPRPYWHSVTIANLASELGGLLKKRNYSVVASDLRLEVGRGRLYTYPDVMVISGEPKLADEHNDILLNPSVLAEVLSPLTERYDRGIKSAQYRTIDSLQEYALVWQSEPRVEVFRRQSSHQWLLTEFVGLDAVCRFDSLDCSVALADIYNKITFDHSDPAPIE